MESIDVGTYTYIRLDEHGREIWQAPKRIWYIVGPVALIMLIGFWLERNVLVWPSLVADDGLAWLGPVQLGIAAGFFGAFALVFLIYSRIFPTLPVPRL